MGTAAFSCSCGQVKGRVHAAPEKGTHLECFCPSCRAGARYCGAELTSDQPLDLYLTTPEHVELTEGRAQLAPFVFSPKGIVRWQAKCCGVQVFSSQPNPKTAFMSVTADRFENRADLGPVVTQSFIPKGNGKTKHKGIWPLVKLVFRALGASASGKWRKTPLYDVTTLKPIVEPTLISREKKAELLAAQP